MRATLRKDRMAVRYPAAETPPLNASGGAVQLDI